ncbi:MAG: YmfQ family protein [Firmicutes bacterium]|nr:YmfQ family protein [Bacillota bacterium]
MRKYLPSYYAKSKVMSNLFDSLESEYERLKQEVQLTENQFFVLLTDKDISKHEADVGLSPDNVADIETRRGRVLSRLRGTGTVTKSMVKNVAASFVNGEIEIVEHAGDYLFEVKFMSKRGVPYNLADIQKVIEDIKPAHLAVEYIFTYRLWQDVLDTLSVWSEVKTYSWENLLTFEVKNNLRIIDDIPYYCGDGGNGIVIWNENRAYAREVV